MTEAFPLAGKPVFVAGHRSMVGSALIRRLARADCEVQTAARKQLNFAPIAGMIRLPMEFDPP